MPQHLDWIAEHIMPIGVAVVVLVLSVIALITKGDGK